MNFLQLCQMTAGQTGTIQDTPSGAQLPTTVTGQIHRLRQIVEFVREAYVDIQNAHRMWRWLRSEFTLQTVAGTTRYAYSDCTDENTGTAVTRFSQWDIPQIRGAMSPTMFLTSTGNTDEGPLRWWDWDDFYDTQLRGPQTPNKPQYISITNDNELIISPVPDDIYTIRGQYIKSPQTLTADSDTPEMPTQFHTLIKDAALCYVEGFDEGPRIPLYRLRMLPNWSMLEHQQLPKPRWGGPLA